MKIQSKVGSKKKIIGSWKLTSFKVERPKRGLVNWAKKFSGLLIYSHQDTMSVSINSFDSKDDSLEHILFYSGNFTVKKDLILHEVKNASSLSRIGKTMFRKSTLSGGTLIIESMPPSPRAILVWEKI